MSREIVPHINVEFDDPNNLFSARQERLMTQAISAAIKLDTANLEVHAGATINLMVHADPSIVRFASAPSAWGATTTPGVVQSAAEIEINTGHPPTNSHPWQDGDIYVNPAYLSELAFNTNSNSSRVVPANKVDAISAFAHEGLHVLGFEGFLDQQATSPSATPSIESNFDALVAYGPSGPTFNGAFAEAQNAGKPVELTAGNLYHVGDVGNLAYDMMNGDHLYTGWQYQPSALDDGMLADLGYRVKPADGGVIAANGSGNSVLHLVQAMASFAGGSSTSIDTAQASSDVAHPQAELLAPGVIQHA
jgi:hypothetical protein